MTTGILTSNKNKFYNNWQLIVVFLVLTGGCAPTPEKTLPVGEAEKILSSGMAILADPAAIDKTPALAAFERSCELGNNYGCHEVGTAYNNGLYGKEKNFSTAKEWYEKAANKDYIPSQLNIANLYAYRLLPLDDETGFTWLVKAGEGIVKCLPGTIEAQAGTLDSERQRLCRLAQLNYKKVLGIFRKRMTGEEMERIEKATLKDLSQSPQELLRSE